MTFPRTNSLGYVDSGREIKHSRSGRGCPNCGSQQYRETVSLEECKACGLRCDYWGGGSNDVYNRMMARDEFEERRAAEERERQWREENGYGY